MSHQPNVEWRVRVADGPSEALPLQPETSMSKLRLFLKFLLERTVFRLWGFLVQAWDIGRKDPRKFMHCIKVGIALSVVSLFYYVRPLYNGVGGASMWSVLTVVVVFEFTVGATMSKCINRTIGTFVAAFLALGIHWIASKSGARFEQIIMGTSVFLLGSGATFSRFIPSVKKRFDYGALIFILTFSLVSVSGYRVEELFSLAHQRLSTIIIANSLCLVSSMLISPVWAGKELHLSITSNMDKLASSLDCCVAEFFNDCGETNKSSEESAKNAMSCRSVLNSKETEEKMAEFAVWEPAHGQFNFRHPWKQYLKIGASVRACACCIEALNSCIIQESQASESVKKSLNEACKRVGSKASSILRELASEMKTMRKSPRVDVLVNEKDEAVREIQEHMKSVSGFSIPRPSSGTELSRDNDSDEDKQEIAVPLAEVIPVLSFASLTMEIATRINGVVNEVQELAKMANFKVEDVEISKQNQSSNIQVVCVA